MVTAWVIKRLSRFNKIIQTIEFYGDAMTQESLETHYSGDPYYKLLSVKQVDPQTAFKTSKKFQVREVKGAQ